MSSSRSRRRRLRKKKSNTKKIILIVALLAVVVTIIVGYNMFGNNDPNDEVPNDNNTSSQMKVMFETSMGNITIQLRDDRPITTENFKNLTLNGVYDNTIFHRVIADFMIQGGDPTGTGLGDPNIPSIFDEGLLSDNNRNDRGTIAMANKGVSNTGSSQFFINLVDNNYLDKPNPEAGISGHTVFGSVVEGMDIVDEISKVETDPNPQSQTFNRPFEDVIIIRAIVID
ncbi:peptidylprolyl isomerase [Thermoproteota archaeon]